METRKEIAAEKNLSFHTINSHRKNIFRKLGVNNVHEATKYAMRAGIVDLAEYYIWQPVQFWKGTAYRVISPLPTHIPASSS